MVTHFLYKTSHCTVLFMWVKYFFCTEHPLNHTLKLQGTEFDNLGRRAVCLCCYFKSVPAFFIFFFISRSGFVSSKSSRN